MDEYPGYDHIQDTTFTWTQRNLASYIPVYMINTNILVSNNYALIVTHAKAILTTLAVFNATFILDCDQKSHPRSYKLWKFLDQRL